jgi:hypothetical protein
MPVMVLYKDKSISNEVVAEMANALAAATQKRLKAKIEVRALEPVYRFNANEVHIEMRFRDFGDYTDEQLEHYHSEVMTKLGDILKKHKVICSYSFYILPSLPPRSLWAQGSTDKD